MIDIIELGRKIAAGTTTVAAGIDASIPESARSGISEGTAIDEAPYAITKVSQRKNKKTNQIETYGFSVNLLRGDGSISTTNGWVSCEPKSAPALKVGDKVFISYKAKPVDGFGEDGYNSKAYVSHEMWETRVASINTSVLTARVAASEAATSKKDKAAV